MEETKLDLKGIFSFLSITFVITYVIEGGLILSGFRITLLPAIYGQLIIAAVMWVPALATILTIKVITREGFAIVDFRFGSWLDFIHFSSSRLYPLRTVRPRSKGLP